MMTEEFNQKTAVNSTDSDLPAYLFHQGTNFTAYDYLGAHGEKTEDGYLYQFRVWAPNAERIALVSDFTSWDVGAEMQRASEGGVWEVAVRSDEKLDGRFYKFAVTGKNGATVLKSDPYAFESETLTKTASVICDISGHPWNDGEWLKKRSATVCPKARGFKPKVNHFYSAPLNI